MLKYRLDLKIYDEVVEINDEVKSLDKKFDVSIFKTKKDLTLVKSFLFFLNNKSYSIFYNFSISI